MAIRQIPKYEKISFERSFKKWLLAHDHYKNMQYSISDDLSVDIISIDRINTNYYFTMREIPFFTINSFTTSNLAIGVLDLLNLKHMPKKICAHRISFSMCEYLSNIENFPQTTENLKYLNFNGCKNLKDLSPLINIVDDIGLSIGSTSIVDLLTIPKNIMYLECDGSFTSNTLTFNNIADIQNFKRLKQFVLLSDRLVKLHNVLDILLCHTGIDFDIVGYTPGVDIVLRFYREISSPIDFMMDAYLALEDIGYNDD